MRKIAISDMTTEQAADDLVMMELSRLFQKARNAAKKAEEAERAVFKALEDMCIEYDSPYQYENGSTLEEAASSYIHYGDYGLKSLLSEIRRRYTKEAVTDGDPKD